METFKDLIELYYKCEEYTQDNVGENRILINKEGFNLIISKNNKETHGVYLVESIEGHDCYSYNTVSTHIYNIIDGEGEFVIDNKIIPVKKGDTITINPNQIFYYSGKMLMIMEMLPDFKEENNHIVETVSYNTPKKRKDIL